MLNMLMRIDRVWLLIGAVSVVFIGGMIMMGTAQTSALVECYNPHTGEHIRFDNESSLPRHHADGYQLSDEEAKQFRCRRLKDDKG